MEKEGWRGNREGGVWGTRCDEGERWHEERRKETQEKEGTRKGVREGGETKSFSFGKNRRGKLAFCEERRKKTWEYGRSEERLALSEGEGEKERGSPLRGLREGAEGRNARKRGDKEGGEREPRRRRASPSGRTQEESLRLMRRRGKAWGDGRSEEKVA